MSTTSVGDPARNESYVIWGADVLAVAAGHVTDEEYLTRSP
jgi:hypothetical protein